MKKLLKNMQLKVFGTNVDTNYFRGKLSVWIFSKCVCGHIKIQHRKSVDECKCCANKRLIRCKSFRPASYYMIINFNLTTTSSEESTDAFSKTNP